ncbi:hypothetical protein B0H14DRAFT_2619694 [Mycena olivaceomarginata]|nr:hypothetical protein B0H14DRAFT_2619694 [Mycena olivaceomarginata]
MTKDWHPEDHISFAANCSEPNMTSLYNSVDRYETHLWPVNCVQDTPGAELAPELNIKKVDKIMEKGQDKRVEMHLPIHLRILLLFGVSCRDTPKKMVWERFTPLAWSRIIASKLLPKTPQKMGPA